MKKKRCIGIFLALSLTIVVIGSYFMLKTYQTLIPPDEILKQYIAYIEAQNYEAMYELLDEQSKQQIALKDFVSRNQKIYEGIEVGPIELTIEEVVKNKRNERTISYTLAFDTVAGRVAFEQEALFKRNRKTGYQLVWRHDLILPYLGATDKVRVSRVEAKRGSLLDRNGTILAGEGVATCVGLVPGKIEENRTVALEQLASLLDLSVESIEKKLSAKWVKADSFVPIQTLEKIDELDLLAIHPDQEVLENVTLQEALLEVPGVMLTDRSVRIYPLKEKASHLTGYVQNVTAEELENHKGEGYSAQSVIGKSGLEKLYEDRLRGKDGYEINIVTEEGKLKKTVASRRKQDGEDIRLTIDAKLQADLYNQFKEDRSTSVAMNPKTGEVLALVSTPSFDANDFIRDMPSKKWAQLNEDENKPLWNRFRSTWCPGSAFKPIVGAIALSNGVLDANEDFGSEGLSWQKDSTWGNYQVTTLKAYEPVTLENALIYSDNIYFAKVALKIGKDKLESELKALGFEEAMPFPIGMYQSQYANTGSIESEIQLADSGYGQGQVLLNPLHLATIYTAFLNEGSMRAPSLSDQAPTETVYWKENIFTLEAAELVKQALIKVIESPNGTGRGGRIEGISLGGKTGTAELKKDKADSTGTELGWFVVFTTDKEEEDALLITTMVEDVKGRGGSNYVVNKDKMILEAFYNIEE